MESGVRVREGRYLMPTYLISYDLVNAKNYPKVWGALEKAGARKATESLWIVEDPGLYVDVLKAARNLVDGDDRVFVALLTPPYFGGYNLLS
jgi:hypothetical protein